MSFSLTAYKDGQHEVEADSGSKWHHQHQMAALVSFALSGDASFIFIHVSALTLYLSLAQDQSSFNSSTVDLHKLQTLKMKTNNETKCSMTSDIKCPTPYQRPDLVSHEECHPSHRNMWLDMPGKDSPACHTCRKVSISDSFWIP